MRRRVYLHSEDLDGWLSLPNHSILPHIRAFLAEVQGLRGDRAGEAHEIQIVLNSGKAPEYLEAEALRFGGRFVISGNGAAWREVGGRTRRFAPPTPDFVTLRRLLGIGPDERNVVLIRLPDARAPIQLALEDKRDEQGDIVISLFPEQVPVAHRWSFHQGIDRNSLREALTAMIREHDLELHVPPPHRDGAVDVLPQVDGRPVGKWTLPLLALQMFPDADLYLAHGGDAINDLSAMKAPGVTPMTAFNCPDVVEAVRRLGGIVSERTPEGGAVIGCYAELARREWYGPLSSAVASICERHLPATAAPAS